MRLLTTNAFHMVSYGVIRSLRNHADYIAVGYIGKEPDDVALSGLVDAVCQLRLPRLVHKDSPREKGVNSPREERYLRTLYETCDAHRIDVIIPTSEYEIFLLSKNRAQFAERGVLSTVPDFDALLAVSDKLRATQTANANGVPIPRTIELQSLDEVGSAARELGFPIVVKARFSYGGLGTRIVRSSEELQATAREFCSWAGVPFLQEYVPGGSEPSLNLVMSSSGKANLTYTLRKARHINMSFSTAVRVTSNLPEAPTITQWMRAVGYTGFAAVQTKLDARDNTHRLIEVNPRLGANSRIVIAMASRIGLNLPLLIVDSHRDNAGAVAEMPIGIRGVSTLEDLATVIPYRRARREMSALGRMDTTVPSPGHWVRSIVRWNCDPRVAHDVFWTGALHDRKAVWQSYRRMFRENDFRQAAPISWDDFYC